jgi:hypothetical protein
MQRDNAYLIDILEAAKLVFEYIATRTRNTSLRIHNVRMPLSADLPLSEKPPDGYPTK